MTNYQTTSAPYSADNLKVHDEDIVFIKEFGTEVTDAAGQSFTTDPGATDPDAFSTVNARMGMLETSSVDPSILSARGTTFLIPPLESYVPSPFFQNDDFRSYALYAHLLLREGSFTDPVETRGGLILAGEGYVGNVPDDPVAIININPADGVGADPEFGEQANAFIENYANGFDAGPTEVEEERRWGTNLYIRLLVIGNVTKDQTDLIVWLSKDGLTWTPSNINFSMPTKLRRVGIGLAGISTTWLDWVRTYNWPLADVPQPNGGIIPSAPLTGGRRFTS